MRKPREFDLNRIAKQSSLAETDTASGSAGLPAAGLEAVLAVVRTAPMLPVVLLVALFLSVSIEGFLSTPNLQNIMRQLSVVLIAAIGETIVLLIGGIDLSVGSVIGLSAVVGAYLMNATQSVALGVGACLLIGALVGAINGLGISRIGIQPFIMTFGMMLTARATAFLLTQGRSIGRLPRAVLRGGVLNIASIPLIFIVAIILVIVVGFVLSRTVFGQHVYLTGSNPRAAAFSGINVKRLVFNVYLISGALSGIAAFVFMMRLGAARPDAGDPLTLQILGAVVLGGTALTGGDGGLVRTFTGSLLIGMLVKSLEILGAQFWDQMIVIGVLIALGSALGSSLSRRRASESRQKAQRAETRADNPT